MTVPAERESSSSSELFTGTQSPPVNLPPPPVLNKTGFTRPSCLPGSWRTNKVESSIPSTSEKCSAGYSRSIKCTQTQVPVVNPTQSFQPIMDSDKPFGRRNKDSDKPYGRGNKDSDKPYGRRNKDSDKPLYGRGNKDLCSFIPSDSRKGSVLDRFRSESDTSDESLILLLQTRL